MAQADRTYDVVLWGATGFTGQYVAEYLAERYESSDLTWAIAGRSQERLNNLRDDLAQRNQDWDSLDVLTGDAFDRESLKAIAEQTQVVCSTVGPYAEYGSNLVKACIEHGTDYCDITGEVHWMRRMIDEHHEEARDNGVRIVHACGFDSVPSDLGTLMVQNHANEHFQTRCSNVKAFVSTSSFKLSGGTIASMVGLFEESSRNPAIRRVIESPYSLAPEGERSGPDEGPQQGPVYNEDIGQWTGPFIMAVINEKVVRRSNALLGYPWGRDFRYNEVTPAGRGLPGALSATITSIGLALLAWVLSVPSLRKLLGRFLLPNPGEGPSRDVIEDNSFEVRLVGRVEMSESEDETIVEGRVAAERDAGYGTTPWMLGESAMCLAKGEIDTPLEGGVLTPASAIGTPLIDRLRDVGMTFTVR